MEHAARRIGEIWRRFVYPGIRLAGTIYVWSLIGVIVMLDVAAILWAIFS